jgi:hypothetical protein
MALHSVNMRSVRAGRAPVPGKPSGFVPGILQFESELLAAIRSGISSDAMFETAMKCNAYGVSDTSSKIRERSSANGTIWTADNTSLIRESDADVMGGDYRWKTSAQAEEGFRGTLTESMEDWDGYTIIVPDFEARSLAANNPIFSVGTNSTQRMNYYITTAGRQFIANQAGSDAVTLIGSEMVVDTRYSLMATYVKSSGATNLYQNSATPGVTDTLSDTPPARTDGAWFGSADDALDSSLLSSRVILIREAITDADAIAAVMTACERIRNFGG